MATEGSSSQASDRRESLTCALCVDLFRDPRLLPCSHTFCKRCLDQLIERSAVEDEEEEDSSVPCPLCRVDIKVPKQGASGFQKNFYIDQEALERARGDPDCPAHRNKRLQILCKQCDRLICEDCKQGEHLHHPSCSLDNAQRDAEKQLENDRARLKRKKENLQRKIAERAADSEEFATKRAAIEEKIRQRHAALVAEANKYLQEALNSLEEAVTESDDTQSTELRTGQNHVENLQNAERTIEEAVQNEAPCQIVNTARYLRTGPCSRDATKRMKVKPLRRVSRAVHCANLPRNNAMFVSMKNFIGRGQQVTYRREDPEVRVNKEALRCGDHDDSIVFCVCPGEDSIYVSFEPSYKNKTPRVKKISADGQTITKTRKEGAYSYGNRTQDKFVYIRQSADRQKRNTYAKRRPRDRSAGYYRLKTSLNGSRGRFMLSEIVSEKPVKTKVTWLFTVICGLHRAMDVDSTEKFFVVVEEARPGGGAHKMRTRRVKLFRRDRKKKSAVDIYQSPLSPWQPADVCFKFTASGEEVLLIADELNDAIHVAEVKDGRLTFSRFLTPGCPALVQPTALNTDPQGRLWVGCRGGTLLTVEPVPTAEDDDDDDDDDDNNDDSGDDEEDDDDGDDDDDDGDDDDDDDDDDGSGGDDDTDDEEDEGDNDDDDDKDDSDDDSDEDADDS